LGLPALLAFGVPLPYQEGFESWNVGDHPAPPWQGVGTVSDEQARSGAKSLKMTGSSATDSIDVPFPDRFTFSYSFMIDPSTTGGGMIGMRKSWGGWTSPINGFEFDLLHDRLIWTGPPTENLLFSPVPLGTWYDASVTINGFLGVAPTADVSISVGGNTVLLTGVPAYSHDDGVLDNFVVHDYLSGSSTIYYDDITIAEVPNPTLDYNPATSNLTMDTQGNTLNGFIITSPGSSVGPPPDDDGDFTGAATLPSGFGFTDNTAEMIAAQFGATLTGTHDFGDGSVQCGWQDYAEWTFTYTLEDTAGVFTGTILGYLPGDVDLDGDIDAFDIQQILGRNRWLDPIDPLDPVGWEDGDFNCDGLVNADDIQMVLATDQYGKDPYRALPMFAEAFGVAVPEPATLGLLALGGLAVLRRKQGSATS